MNTPNIKMVRIDERLIHGQGQMWIKSLGVNLCIVANDSAANDPLQQSLMKAVVQDVGMRFFTIEHTCKIIHKAAPTQIIFIVVASPKDALRLVEGGVPIDHINVGNVHKAEGKEKISNYIYLGPEDKAALQEINTKHQISFDTRTSPLAPDVDALEKLMAFIKE